ncbi:MAG: hypothetical protein ACP5N1_01245 [Candidatus Woesearchaeota archaeon]
MRKVNPKTKLGFGELENLLERNGFERMMELKYRDNATARLDISPLWEVYLKDYNGLIETAYICDDSEIVIHRDYSKQTRFNPQSKVENYLIRYYDWVVKDFNIKKFREDERLFDTFCIGAISVAVGSFVGSIMALQTNDPNYILNGVAFGTATGLSLIKLYQFGSRFINNSKMREYNKSRKIIVGSDALDYLKSSR